MLLLNRVDSAVVFTRESSPLSPPRGLTSKSLPSLLSLAGYLAPSSKHDWHFYFALNSRSASTINLGKLLSGIPHIQLSSCFKLRANHGVVRNAWRTSGKSWYLASSPHTTLHRHRFVQGSSVHSITCSGNKS